MARRTALVYLTVASPLVLACFAVGGALAEALFVVLVMAFPVALIALAVSRSHGLGPLGVPILLLLVVLEGSGVAMLALRGRVLDVPWVGGLPAGAAVLLYGLWLVPLPLVALAYALTFERFGLNEDQLEALEAGRRRDEETG